jgi:hypothetical protein
VKAIVSPTEGICESFYDFFVWMKRIFCCRCTFRHKKELLLITVHENIAECTQALLFLLFFPNFSYLIKTIKKAFSHPSSFLIFRSIARYDTENLTQSSSHYDIIVYLIAYCCASEVEKYKDIFCVISEKTSARLADYKSLCVLLC